MYISGAAVAPGGPVHPRTGAGGSRLSIASSSAARTKIAIEGAGRREPDARHLSGMRPTEVPPGATADRRHLNGSKAFLYTNFLTSRDFYCNYFWDFIWKFDFIIYLCNSFVYNSDKNGDLCTIQAFQLHLKCLLTSKKGPEGGSLMPDTCRVCDRLKFRPGQPLTAVMIRGASLRIAHLLTSFGIMS